MNKEKRIHMLMLLKNMNLDSDIKLNFNTPFELLIAVLLSAQTKDISVNKVTSKLYSRANTPEKILDIGIEGIKEYIKNIGLFNRKSENIIKTCQILIEKYGSIVPENRDDLQSLPGVGRKTANVVLNIAFNWPTIAVDTHVFRVSNRTQLAPGKTVREVEDKLIRVVPSEFKLKCHFWLISHGRNICVARKPRCNVCLIQDLCEYELKR
ncbi:endonuclease III [Pantoea sp. Mhis]|uniref:endonuclease III n=1 Tax=Pantoea sp. Mhis TaxID=2576759 RepID=UPI001357B9FA|nr:endonuclease III [Pantoea sp. Mhis]MXP56200.1 endonuclease III [Pantoea sp. Mhis]